MIRPIRVWPDPVLTQISLPISSIDDDIRALVSDMLETMYSVDGVGLAAVQVGIPKRLVVIDLASYDHQQNGASVDVPQDEPPLVLVNPVLSQCSGSLTWEEGCLSVPGETGLVTRSAKCTCSYTDLSGKGQVIEAEGLKAIALQHECDHLDGKVFVQYLSKLKRDVIRKKMTKLILGS